MDYQVSARKYRPGTFQDVVGQSHVVQTLVNAITTKRVAHAFLFSGTRGVGKTTVARILAKALNCEQGPGGHPCNTCSLCVEITQSTSMDVIEIDGASNTSVDDVREVRENVKFAPFRGRYRVYIIDEVHMLSNSAFNALLKTLEEPPAHVVFIFATTEVHKIPATILSRCQHYNFRRISRSEIIERLRHVAEREGVTVEDRSLAALARASEGSMRDALSLLDQAVAFDGKTLRHEDVEILLGAVPQEHVEAMISAIVTQDSPKAIRVIADLLDQGHDLRAYCREVVDYVRHLLVASVVPSAQELQGLIEVSEDERHQIRTRAQTFSPEHLQELFQIFSQTEDSLRVTAHPRFVLEAATVRATRLVGNRPSTSGESPAPVPISSIPQGRNAIPQGQLKAPVPTDRSSTKASDNLATPVPTGPDSRSPQATVIANSPDPDRVGVEPEVGSSSSAVSGPDTPVKQEPILSRGAPPEESAQPRSESPDRTSLPTFDWERFQEQVALAYPNIGSFLERGAFIGMEDHQITIGYSKIDTVARAIVEKAENLHTLNDLCTETTGRPLRIRVVELSDEKMTSPGRAQARAAQRKDQKGALLEQTRSHPLIKHALGIFGGEVVEVRKVSPQKEVGE